MVVVDAEDLWMVALAERGALVGRWLEGGLDLVGVRAIWCWVVWTWVLVKVDMRGIGAR